MPKIDLDVPPTAWPDPLWLPVTWRRLPLASVTSGPPMLILSGMSNACAAAGEESCRQQMRAREAVAR